MTGSSTSSSAGDRSATTIPLPRSGGKKRATRCARNTWRRWPKDRLRRRAVYGRDFRQQARRIGIDAIATPVRSPRANAVVERLIGTLRRECLDHLLILDEHHLLWVLRELVAYYTQ